MAALVSDLDLDERLHQSGPLDLPAEEVVQTPPPKKKLKSYNANA